jgi:hypothetical protein
LKLQNVITSVTMFLGFMVPLLIVIILKINMYWLALDMARQCKNKLNIYQNTDIQCKM